MFHSAKPEEPTIETCCLCIPLRLGVFLNCFATVFVSISMLVFKSQMDDALRVFGGGYVVKSAVIIGFIEITGCMWGVLGLLGVYHEKLKFVRTYNYYQMVRIAAWVMMYYTDLPVLLNCEMWITNIDGALKKYGWNETMYRIAYSGGCFYERIAFIVFSTLGFIFFSYLTWVNQRYQDQLQDSDPEYQWRKLQKKGLADMEDFFPRPQKGSDPLRPILGPGLRGKYVGEPVKYDPMM